MQLSYQLQMFSHFFMSFLKCTFNFEHSEKKYEVHSSCFSEIIDGERRADVNAYGVTFQYNLGQSTC